MVGLKSTLENISSITSNPIIDEEISGGERLNKEIFNGEILSEDRNDREASNEETLPGLLHQGCRDYPNDYGLNQWNNGQWDALSNRSFQTDSEHIALGLLQLGLLKGDRVALLMHSDRQFCLADMACLSAGCVSVPIDLTQTVENIIFIVQYSGAKALMVSDCMLLSRVRSFLDDISTLQWIIIDQPDRYQPTCHPSDHDQSELEDREEDELRLLHPWQRQSHPLEWWSLTAVRQIGAVIKTAEGVAQLLDAIHPSDLATIVYISGEQGRPKGVMLSHGAIASNILSAFRV
ncbi:MAG: AMP-binding protein, partial [Symploca sp. SIO2B6]|nr:AMP-binding protein [Symploca sp. SIO2B6]